MVDTRRNQARNPGHPCPPSADLESHGKTDDRARPDCLFVFAEHVITGQPLERVIARWKPSTARTFGYWTDEASGHSMSVNFLSDQISAVPVMARGESTGYFKTGGERKHRTQDDGVTTISRIMHLAGRIVSASKLIRGTTWQETNEDSQ